MIKYVSLGLSVAAVGIALFSPPQVVGTAKYQPENLTIAEEVKIIDSIVLDLTEAVEELRVEIAHVHEHNIEIGDNLNKRIDDMSTGLAAIKEDTVAAAQAAAERAEAAAAASQGYYQSTKDYVASIDWCAIVPSWAKRFIPEGTCS